MHWPFDKQMSSQDQTITEPSASDLQTQKPSKVPKKPKAPKEKGSDSGEKKVTIRSKRGPARPHRRLELDVINTRITKLEKRLVRAKSQVEDAGRHVEGYIRERDFRAKEESSTSSPVE